MKKQRFSLEQHISAGATLKHVRHQLMALECDVSKSYLKSGPEKTSIYKAIKEIDRARSELEDRMFEELPADACTSIYYGEAPAIPAPEFIDAINAIRAEVSAALERVEDAIHGCEDTPRVGKASEEAKKLRDVVNRWTIKV